MSNGVFPRSSTTVGSAPPDEEGRKRGGRVRTGAKIASTSYRKEIHKQAEEEETGLEGRVSVKEGGMTCMYICDYTGRKYIDK
jgi:hypothetical protein